MDMNVVITYETLYEILRNEKTKNELQKLEEDFFSNTVGYLNDKTSILGSQQKKSGIFASNQVSKTQKELDNIKRMIREIYERRENKIIQLALFASRSNEKTEFYEMLPEEKKLYRKLINIFSTYREGILNRVLSSQMPEIQQEEKPKDLKIENKAHNRLLKFVHATPKFVGEDLKTYGPFEEEDVASLPSKIASLLIKNKRAEGMLTK